MKKAKNLRLIQQSLARYFILGYAVVALIAFFLKAYTLISSLGLGILFSYVIFINFIYSQTNALIKKNVGFIIPQFFIRLLLYAIPLCVGLYYKPYFKIPIILISLFSFQAFFVLSEVCRSIKRYRKRLKHG